VLCISSHFPEAPPTAVVEHQRFVGFPHVILGHFLCVHLDVTQEWDPDEGMPLFLRQLRSWFENALAGRFNAADALYHPVGGLQMLDYPQAPMTVIRELPQFGTGWVRRGHLRERTPHRMDVHWNAPGSDGDHYTVAIRLQSPLYMGTRRDLRAFMSILERPRRGTTFASLYHAGWPRAASVLDTLAVTAWRNPPGTPLYFILVVPNPAAATSHLLVGRLPPELADDLRRAVSQRRLTRAIDPSAVPEGAPIYWTRVSDERAESNTRRDQRRPVKGFAETQVFLWGCGGIGSWVAEFLVRAGLKRIVLCDPGKVTGGLLVRQNYTEQDVGSDKVLALSRRLQALNDSVEVACVSRGEVDMKGGLEEPDVVIDCTVNPLFARHLDMAMRDAAAKPLSCEMAVDSATGTLGMLCVAAPADPAGPATIDREVGARILGDTSLEGFHTFWQPPVQGAELTPTRGCSVPTFRASAADVAAVAGSLVSILGMHLDSPVSGVHLLAGPHAQRSGATHTFVGYY
jgi:hypothetical protein